MILTALNQYYDRLADQPDPDTGKLQVPEFGFSNEKINYILVISKDGDIVDVVPNTETIGNQTKAKSLFVPASFKRSGKYTEKAFNSGKENAFFLWDKTAYSLGLDVSEDKNSENSWVESPITFKSFKRFHFNNLTNINDKGLQAFLMFLEKWQPSHFDRDLHKPEILGTNLAFQLDGDRCYLHERPAAKKLWTQLLEEPSESTERNCLVTGKRDKIARLHPSIKGVYGGQSSGGSIVSFNAESYESYGKVQGENAPVSELAAFKYTTALNYLLNRDNKHCLSVGDTSTVFWAIAPDSNQAQKAENIFEQIVNPSDDGEAAQLKPLIEQISKGRPLPEVAPDIDPDTRFYLLGLAPNASRLSIRYWLDTTFGQLGHHMGKHYTDLSLDPLPWKKPPSILRLLIELVPYRPEKKIKFDDIPSHLAGEMMRSFLTGDRYPHSLLAQLVLRIRSDGHISPLRVAMIKAVLHRDCRKLNKEEIPVGLDENNDNDAYQLGRLFAVLERIQKVALEKYDSTSGESKKINSTITDRYFGTASTVPYSVFPRLLVGATKHHLPKIRKNQNKKIAARAYYLKGDMDRIISKLPHVFSKHLSIEDQGRFCIGYYHQRTKKFVSNNEVEATSDSSTETN